MLTGNTRSIAPRRRFGLGLRTQWRGFIRQLDSRVEHGDEFRQRQSDGDADIPHLNQVKPTLAAFHITDKGLGTPELSGKTSLSEARPKADVPEQLDQNLRFLTMERLGHGRHLCCAAKKLDTISRYLKNRCADE